MSYHFSYYFIITILPIGSVPAIDGCYGDTMIVIPLFILTL